MPVFEYIGKDAAGKTVKGSLDVENARALKAALRRDRVFLTEYHETGAKGGKAKVKAGAVQKQGSPEVDLKDLFTRISPQDIAEVTRQMATLLKAGVPLVDGLAATVGHGVCVF